MLVRDLMTRNVSSCPPENNLAELAEVMWNHRCGALPILDDSGRVMDIITDRYLYCTWDKEHHGIGGACTRCFTTGYVNCNPYNNVWEALKTIATQEVSRLAVVDEAGHRVGILSIDDIVFRARGGRSNLKGP
jgi:CBS domain-containing protein